jgi:hypothetical protein
MASRENQGLQIALIIFVMLTIILSVTTFIFFDSSKGHRETAAAAKKTADEATNRERTIQEERNTLALKLGLPETAEKKDIDDKIAADIKKNAEFFKLQLPEDQRNYTRLVEELAKTIEQKNKDLIAAKEMNDTLRKQVADAETKFTSTLKAYETDKEKAVQGEKANQAKYTSDVAELSKSKEAALGKIAAKDEQYTSYKAKADGEVKRLSDALTAAQSTVETKQGLIEELSQPAPTVPDGKVVWVDQRNNTVFVNLGADDGLRRRITFSVFDRDATDAANAVKKGSIEVLNVRGPHLAQARILESVNADPIVPGDIIYTPVWHPGQTQHFAIAGFIDFDNDLVSDRDKLKDIINYNGGVIDAEMDDKGKVTGRISNLTQFLILGSPPSEDQEELQTGYTVLRREATTYGVPSVKLDAFLAQIGYSVRPSVTGGSNTSGPRTIRDSGGTPDRTKTSGEGFRTRQPPSAKNGKSNGAD